MSAPERTWAWKHRVQDGHWIGGMCTSKPGGMATEYVRADLHAAMSAERDALKAENRTLGMEIISLHAQILDKGDTE